MKETVDSLLEPISADSPCGEDIGYDPQFIELESMLQGKEETQFAASEEPDWKAVEARCLELFRRSKDLRVALRLCLSLLKTSGIPGFRDGLLVMKGMIERLWESFYPRLNPDDNNDPLERINILSSLTTPHGTFGDPLQFLARIRQAPLTDSPQLGRITMLDFERGLTDGAEKLSESQAQAAFRSTPPERLQEIYEAIIESQTAVKEMDNLLTKLVGANQSVAFDPLASALRALQKAVAPYVTTGAAEGIVDEAAPASGGDVAVAGPGISGTVRSRQDVMRVLDQVCEFYTRNEPSSPVPLLIQRVRRMVDMDFVALIAELVPDSMSQVNAIAGIRPE